MLDKKLYWKEHVEYLTRKFLNGYWTCKRIVGAQWGPKQALLKWLYEAVLVPRMTHGAVHWWTRAELLTDGRHQGRLQAMMLRCMVRAMKSIPMAALSVISGVSPLNLRIREAGIRSKARLRILGKRGSVISRY